jgi:predicted metallopeptidase
MRLQKPLIVRYTFSREWTGIAREIASALALQHIDLDRIAVIESEGSKSKATIARIHSLGKVMQLGMGERPFYTIELISRRFNRQSEEEKIKTIIHELLHIPACFGGGFRPHQRYVNRHTVENEFQRIKDIIHNQFGKIKQL